MKSFADWVGWSSGLERSGEPVPAGLYLLLSAVKASLLIGVAFAAIHVRRFSAAERHAVLLVGLLGALLLPILDVVLSPLSLRSIPDLSANPDLRHWSDNALALIMVRLDASEGVPVRASWRATMHRLDTAILSLWLTGTVLLLLRIATNLVAAGRVRRRAVMWQEISPGVRLMKSSAIGAPVTAGVFRPAILLPEGFVLTDAVITHELAHVRRRDCLTLFLTQLACAIYWFNPLVWFAARRIALDQERAADDCVLASGEDPVAYSELLLETAQKHVNALRLHAVSSMALPSHLERRITSILDTREARGLSHRRWVAAVSIVIVCVMAPLAALAVHDGFPPGAGLDALMDPQSERVPGTRDFRGYTLRYDQSTVDGTLIARLVDAAARESDRPYDLVPDRARWALSLVRDGRVIEPLINALHDRDWRVCAYAAWALSYSGDPRSVDALLPLLDHRVWRVRAMAAAALRSLGDPRARSEMAKALRDPAWQVRVEAVAYFGAQDQSTFREQLVPLRNDPHIAVRLAADESLN